MVRVAPISAALLVVAAAIPLCTGTLTYEVCVLLLRALTVRVSRVGRKSSGWRGSSRNEPASTVQPHSCDAPQVSARRDS